MQPEAARYKPEALGETPIFAIPARIAPPFQALPCWLAQKEALAVQPERVRSLALPADRAHLVLVRRNIQVVPAARKHQYLAQVAVELRDHLEMVQLEARPSQVLVAEEGEEEAMAAGVPGRQIPQEALAAGEAIMQAAAAAALAGQPE